MRDRIPIELEGSGIDHPLSDMTFGDRMRPWWQAARDLFARKRVRNWRDGSFTEEDGRIRLMQSNGRTRHAVSELHGSECVCKEHPREG